jgi:hypothetical protein
MQPRSSAGIGHQAQNEARLDGLLVADERNGTAVLKAPAGVYGRVFVEDNVCTRISPIVIIDFAPS